MRARRAVKIAPPAEPEPRSAIDIAGDLAGIGGHLKGIEHQLRELGFESPADAEQQTRDLEGWAWSVLMDALARERDRIEKVEKDMYYLHRAMTGVA